MRAGCFIDPEIIQFCHFIVSSGQPFFFAHAKAGDRIENLLIYPEQNIVKRQVGSHFEALPQSLARVIRAKAMRNYETTEIFRVPRYYFV